MHAYLFTGIDQDAILNSVEDFALKNKYNLIEFSIEKIAQVRELKNFVKLKREEGTAIFISNVDNATLPALNAFLKTLEEPQKNITFILTAASIYKVIPTIVSRCLVIKVKDQKSKIKNSDQINTFFESGFSNKINLIDRIKGREEAKIFMEQIIKCLHDELHTNKGNLLTLKNNIENADNCLNALISNGNVGLQLTYFCVNYQ